MSGGFDSVVLPSPPAAYDVAVPALTLPPGRHYAVMYGVTMEAAGMTNSMLHRTRDLVRETGAEITIVTDDERDTYDDVDAHLREREALIDGITIRNLWLELRDWTDTQLAGQSDTFTPGADAAFAPLGDGGDHASPFFNRRHDVDGALLQTDYLRADGTLLASDRHDGPAPFERTLTLCDTSGKAIGTWSDPAQLYYAWLDTLPRDPVAWLICDDKAPAKALTRYDRPDVVKIHVVRGTHLLSGTGRPMGTLSPHRRVVMENLDAWDAVVFLTEAQRSDVEALMGPHDNLHVIPNNRPVPTKVPNLLRPSRRGVMLASLDGRKQIGHVVRALSRVGRVRGRSVTVDVWGQGPREAALRKLIKKYDSPVRLRGHSPAAAEEFETTSFSLLTSKSEGSPNVLIESMGRGCIPISYDTPYGPSDTITHGVNGFLVPLNDMDALTAQIREVAAMRQWKLARMRKAAHRRALDFADTTGRWVDLLNTLQAARD